MDANFQIKFKTVPYSPNTGDRFIPEDAIEVQHPDGKILYLNPMSYERAVEMLIMNCKFNTKNKDAKYLAYLYCEHILDFDDEKMFFLALEDFENWHTLLV